MRGTCKQPLCSIVAVEWNKCLLSLLAEVSHDEAWDLCKQGSVCLVYFYFLITWECCTCTILPNSDSSPRSSPPFNIVSPSRPSGWGYRDTLASPRTLWTVDCIVSLARAALNEDHKQFVILLQYMYSVNLFMMRLQTDWKIWFPFSTTCYESPCTNKYWYTKPLQVQKVLVFKRYSQNNSQGCPVSIEPRSLKWLPQPKLCSSWKDTVWAIHFFYRLRCCNESTWDIINYLVQSLENMCIDNFGTIMHVPGLGWRYSLVLWLTCSTSPAVTSVF